MARLSASTIALALGIAASLGLLACGEGNDAELLPGSTAEEINANLDQVEQLAAEEDCVGAGDAAEQVSLQVEGLEGVDAKLKRALTNGVNRLREVVAGCEEEESEEEPEEVIEPEEEVTTEPEDSSKEEEKREKEREKSERQEEKEAEEPTESESLPPQAKGEGKEQAEPEPQGETGGAEPPAGGLSPSTPAGAE